MISYQPQWQTNSKKSTYFKNRLKIIEPYIKDNSSIIDIGCNYGWNSFELSNKKVHITGIDTFTNQRSRGGQIDYYFQAQETIKQFGITNVQIIKDDVTNYLKHNRFDIGLCLLLLHHYLQVPNQFDINDENFGLLKEGFNLVNLIKTNCDICFFQLRINNSQNDLLKYFFKVILEYNNVDILTTNTYYYCSPNPIIMCS